MKRIDIRMQRYKYNRIVRGMNKYNAARQAGYSMSTAKRASKIEDRMKDELHDLLEQKGFTDNQIISIISKGLGAMKEPGKIDWSSRHKYLVTLLELKGNLKNKFEAGSGTGSGTKVIVVYPEGYKSKEVKQGDQDGTKDQAQSAPSRISIEQP